MTRMQVFTFVSGQRGSKMGPLVITGIIHFNHQVEETIEFVLLSLVLRHFENSRLSEPILTQKNGKQFLLLAL